MVEEVAESVIARMHAAEEAVLRHIEAMEVEATRRYELVTAQAELDAELIRLQSRREAHAIVSAARMRAGEIDDVDDDPDDEGHRLVGVQRRGRPGRRLHRVLAGLGPDPPGRPPVMSEPSRQRRAQYAVAVVAAFAVLLAGCGGNDDDATAAAPTTSSSTVDPADASANIAVPERRFFNDELAVEPADRHRPGRRRTPTG